MDTLRWFLLVTQALSLGWMVWALVKLHSARTELERARAQLIRIVQAQIDHSFHD